VTQIAVSGVAAVFGATEIFRDVTFTVAAGEKWGIVGRNGCGKTTLFHLLTGAHAPAAGTIARQPGLTLALLDQHRGLGDATTVWEAGAMAYAPLLALERRLAETAARLAELGEGAPSALLDAYGHDLERFAHEGGYDYPARVDAILQGMGFDAVEARTRPVVGLSGGERGRLGLAAQLATPADVLLLDEPTNHLDLETTEWLERWLAQTDRTVLVVSHDRAFLDDVVDHVLHFEGGSASAYVGGFSSFVEQRSLRRLTQQRALEKQRAAVAREEDYIRRHIAGQNSAQAKGRRKRLERLPRLSPPPGAEGAMALRLEAAERGGDQVIVADRLTIAVGDRVLVREFTAVAQRGDVIALVGPNGAGKSTFIRTLLGDRPADGGSVRLGGSITAAWYRQDLAQVPLDRRIYDVIQDLRPLWERGAIQGHLGCFGFSGDEVLRPTKVLSGGERARVALAMIVLQRANLLVLDEPTNHLDVESIEVLEDAIEEYEGNVLLVSHDRAILRELATRVWWFDGDRVHDYPGTFAEWEAMRAERRRGADRAAKAAADAPPRGAKASPRRADAEDRGARRVARESAAAAERVAQEAEARVAALTAALEDTALYDGSAAGARRAGELTRELERARRAHEDALAAWLAAAE
jgi:ATP-binding cassette subfamily F protein 3